MKRISIVFLSLFGLLILNGCGQGLQMERILRENDLLSPEGNYEQYHLDGKVSDGEIIFTDGSSLELIDQLKLPPKCRLWLWEEKVNAHSELFWHVSSIPKELVFILEVEQGKVDAKQTLVFNYATTLDASPQNRYAAVVKYIGTTSVTSDGKLIGKLQYSDYHLQGPI